MTSLVSDNPAATEAISLNGELAVLRFRKTKRFGVFRNFRVISMRFAVLLCYSVRCSLLLRRFVFRMAEASAKRVTGDEPQGTMGRVQTPVVSFPPSFARTFSSKERRLGTRLLRGVYTYFCAVLQCSSPPPLLTSPLCN